MIKFNTARKAIAILANVSLLFNSFVPFLLVAQPAYAQSSEMVVPTIEYSQSTNKLNTIVNTSEKVAYQLFYKTDKIDAIAGNDLTQADFYLGTCSSNSCLPQNISRGILKTESNSKFYSQFFTLENNVLTITKESESSQSDLTKEENDFLNDSILGATTEWTFKNVELNKEYVAPQNNGVKLTFTKLPENSGNIKIQEITLSKEQIEQSGSLSDKAYDITSDMVDGTFVYNLSLPIPSFVNETDVDIKYTEEILKLDLSQSVKQVSTTDTSVSTKNLDHFTVFFVVIKITDKNLVEKEIFKKGETVYINTAVIDVAKTKVRIKDSNGVVKKTYNETLSPIYQYAYTIDLSDSIGEYSVDIGSYQITGISWSGIKRDWVWKNNVDNFNIVEGICGDGIIDHNEICDDGNLSNNDGCSNSCVIENGWKCKNNDQLSNCKLITSPIVTIIDPTPEENTYVKGVITGRAKAVDDSGMGSYYLRFWENAFESGSSNLMKSCYSAPGGSILGTTQDVNCQIDSNTLSDGKYVFSAQFLNEDIKWGLSLRTFYVDNTPPIATIDNITPKSFYNGSTDINVHVIDNNYLKTELYQDGSNSPFKTYEESIGTGFSLSQLSDGKYKMVVIDKANNSTEYNFTIDKVIPTFKLTDDSNPSILIANGVIINPDKLGDRDNNGNTIRFSKESVSDTLYLNNNPIFGHGYYNKGTSGQIGAAFVNEGTYTLYTKDESGNQSSTITFIVDKTAPIIPTAIFTPKNGSNVLLNGVAYTNSQYFKFNLTSSTDTTRYQLKYWNDILGSAFKQNKPWNPTNLSGYSSSLGVYNDNFTQGEGKHYLSFSACDAANNCSTYTTNPLVVIYDKTPPKSTINGGGNNTTIYSSSWDGSLSGTAQDTNGVKEVLLSIKNDNTNQFWNGSAWQIGSTLVTAEGKENWTYSMTTAPSEGSYTIESHAIDNASNKENTYTLTIVLDKTIPEINISLNPTVGDASNGWYKTQPEVTLTATDNILTDKIEYQWDSEIGAWTTYSNSFKPTTEGAHVLYYRAIDKATNLSDIGVKNIKWDQTDLEYGPQNITANPNPTSGSTSKIKWEFAKDNTGIDKYEIQWKLNDNTYYSKTVGAGTTEVEIDNLTEGRWTVKVIAFDQSGKTKDNSIDVIVDQTGPTAPVLTLTGTGTGTATLSWNAIDDAKDYIIWYGSVQGVHQFGARVGNVTSYTVKGLGAGNYYFIIKAVDEAQNQSADSNEINTGTITGAVGTTPGQPAEGFTPEVLGATTEEINPEKKSSTEDKIDVGNVLGISTEKGFNWWWLSLLLLIIPLYIGGKKISKKRK